MTDAELIRMMAANIRAGKSITLGPVTIAAVERNRRNPDLFVDAQEIIRAFPRDFVLSPVQGAD